MTVEVVFVIIWFSIVGRLFGAVHCLAWNPTFPTLHRARPLASLRFACHSYSRCHFFSVYASSTLRGDADELGKTVKSPLVIPLYDFPLGLNLEP